MSFIISGPPPNPKPKTYELDPDLIVPVPCDLCKYGWLVWSWDFEHLMLCCPCCHVGDPIYKPFRNELFVKALQNVPNWICVSIQSIE